MERCYLTQGIPTSHHLDKVMTTVCLLVKKDSSSSIQPISTVVVGDVANWKHHQRMDEILIFFLPALHRRNQQSCFQNNSVMQYAHET